MAQFLVQVTDAQGNVTEQVVDVAFADPLTAGSASAVAGDGQVELSASPPSGGEEPYEYEWHRDTAQGFTPAFGTKLEGATTLEHSDTDVVDETYYYVLRVLDATGADAFSGQVSATPTASAPEPEPEPEEPPPPPPEPPEDVIAFILGPQVAAGSHPWTVFDEHGAAQAEKWADAFLNNKSGGDDYYDLASCLWQLHARTGNPRHLELAQQVALKKWNGLPAGVDWGTNPTPFGKAPRSIPFAGLTLLALTVETPVQTFNDKGTPVELTLWEWLEGYCERMNGSWLERWDDPDSTGVHSGIRDGGMLLHYLAILSRAHPDEAVRTRMLDHALTAARDYYARVQEQGEYAHGAWLWKADTTQPFQVGLLMEGLIATHILTADPEVGRAIRDGVFAIGRDMVQWTPVDHEAWSHKNMDASYYLVYGGDCDPPIASGCGNNMDPLWSAWKARNKIRSKRHTNTLLIHCFGYAYRLTGDEQFKVWGDRLMDSIFGDPDFPPLNSKGKEYNQVLRSSGRYLGWTAA